MLVDEVLVDNVMVFSAFVYNVCIIVVFAARALERDRLETAVGYVVNLLLVPFFIFWVLNALGGREVGLLITGMPIILFLLYDLWYRTLRQDKPTHHPAGGWPYELYIYLVLYLLGSMLLVGYVFLVSLSYGFTVLAAFYCSLASYGYYQYKYRKRKTAVQ